MAKKWNFRVSEYRREDINHPFFLLRYRTEWAGGNYGIVDANVCFLQWRNNEDYSTPNTVTYDDYLAYEDGQDPTCVLAGLMLRAQRNPDKSTNDGKLYGYDVRYEYKDIRSDEIEKAELRVKFLKQYNANMKKIQAEFGYCQNFEQWLIFTSKALSIDLAVLDPNYNNGIRLLKPDDVHSWVRYKVYADMNN